MRALGPKIKPIIGAFVVAFLMFTGIIAVSGSKNGISHEEGLKDNPTTAKEIESVIQEVLSLNKTNRHQEAVEVLLKTIERQPKDSLLRAMLVQTFELFLEDEINAGHEQLAHDQKNGDAYSRVANALYLLGNDDKAAEILLNGLDVAPNSTKMWMKLAQIEMERNRKNSKNEALDIFLEVVRLDPNHADALNNAAAILSRSEKPRPGDLEKAKTLADKALKIDPKNPDYLDTLAEIYFRQGNKEKALALIEEAIERAPDRLILKSQLERFKAQESVK